MSTHRVLQAGAGLALAALLAAAGGCAAPTDPQEQAAAPEVGQPGTELLGGVPGNPVTPPSTGGTMAGFFNCSSSQGASTLVVSDDGTCSILRGISLPGATNTYCFIGVCPACWALARNAIGCSPM
jgi:hypothetical protein